MTHELKNIDYSVYSAIKADIAYYTSHELLELQSQLGIEYTVKSIETELTITPSNKYSEYLTIIKWLIYDINCELRGRYIDYDKAKSLYTDRAMKNIVRLRKTYVKEDNRND